MCRGSAWVLQYRLDLLESGARLGGLHMRLDELVVEIGQLLVVDGLALGCD